MAKLGWLDHHGGGTYRITTSGDTGGRGIARVQTYRDVVAEYRVHPEAKSAGPDGAPCGRATVGELRRRDVLATGADAGLVHDEAEVSTEYVDPRRSAWRRDQLAAVRALPTAALARELGVDRSTVKRWKAGAATPRARRREAIGRLLPDATIKSVGPGERRRAAAAPGRG